MKVSQFPVDFIQSIQKKLGPEFDAFIASHDHPVAVSLRINKFKSIMDFNELEKVKWATDAYYLPERISFTLDPLFHAGCYYVQESSSMFLEQVFNIACAPDCLQGRDGQPLKILDLCASPGGKSTHIASIMPKGSLLVSNEVISSRNNILQQNISKWGVENVVVTQNEAVDFARLKGFFDIILVDAPCSGEGLFRKDAAARDQWSVANVEMCSSRQTTILQDVYPALKQGGYLIYSTCTYEEKENELQVQKLNTDFEMEIVNLNDDIPGPVPNKFGKQFYPHHVKGEGFFISLLKKTQETQSVPTPKLKTGNQSHSYFLEFLEEPNRFSPFEKNHELYAMPSYIHPEIALLMSNLFVRKAGIHIGTIKGNNLVPAHELALSISLRKSVPRIEVSREDAIRFLRCESVHVKGVSNGWTAITYDSFPLGWIKVIGARSNNYFPRPLRILKEN